MKEIFDEAESLVYTLLSKYQVDKINEIISDSVTFESTREVAFKASLILDIIGYSTDNSQCKQGESQSGNSSEHEKQEGSKGDNQSESNGSSNEHSDGDSQKDLEQHIDNSLTKDELSESIKGFDELDLIDYNKA